MTRSTRVLAAAAWLAGVAFLASPQAAIDDETSEAAAGRSPTSASGAASGDTANAVSFEVGAGLEHDSNVAVLELDASADAGDVAALLELGVGYDRPAEAKLDFGAARVSDADAALAVSVAPRRRALVLALRLCRHRQGLRGQPGP
jgi:hypothetical protein